MKTSKATNNKRKIFTAFFAILFLISSPQIESANAYGEKIIANFPKSIKSGQTAKVTFQVQGVSRAHCRIREQGQADIWFNVTPKGSINYRPIRGFGFVQCFWGDTSYATMSYNVKITY